MFEIPRDGITDAAKQIDELKTKGFPLVGWCRCKPVYASTE